MTYSKEEVIEKVINILSNKNMNVSLFGSYARDEQDEFSDIDLLLFEDTREIRIDWDLHNELKNLLEIYLNKTVSLNWEFIMKRTIKETVMNEAIVIKTKRESKLKISEDINN